MSKKAPIIVVLEGGLVQGVYTRTTSPQDVVVIDYGDDDISSEWVVAVPQPDGGSTNAWVYAYTPSTAAPVIADFADQFVGETYE